MAYSSQQPEVTQIIDVYPTVTSECINIVNQLHENQHLQPLLIVPTVEFKNYFTMISKYHADNLSLYTTADIAKHPHIRLCATALRSIDAGINQKLKSLCREYKINENILNTTLNAIKSTQQQSDIFSSLLKLIRPITQYSELNYPKAINEITLSIIYNLSRQERNTTTSHAIYALEKAVVSYDLSKLNKQKIYVALVTETIETMDVLFDSIYFAGLNYSSRHTLIEKLTIKLQPPVHSIFYSAHMNDLRGRETILPSWGISNHIKNPPHLISEVFRKDNIGANNQNQENIYLSQLIAPELSTTNVLAHIDTSLSPTGIEQFSRCPAQFFYQRILKLEKKPGFDAPGAFAQQFGTLIHSCLDEITTSNNNTTDIDDVINNNIQTVDTANMTPIQYERFIERTRSVLSSFIEFEKQHPSVIEATELNVQTNIDIGDNTFSLLGKIDRIHTTAQSRVIVDYKTGSKKSSTDPLQNGRRIQLALYALLVEGTITSLEYWYMNGVTMMVERLPWEQDLRNRAINILESVSLLYSKGIFIPRPEIEEVTSNGSIKGTPCDTCIFETYCYDEVKALWNIHSESDVISRYKKATTFEVASK